VPQENLTVTGDPNFSRPAKIRGVKLEELVLRLAAGLDPPIQRWCVEGPAERQ